MPVLSQRDRETLEKRFKKDLNKDVTITLVTVRSAGILVVPGRECPTCPQTQQLVEEVASLSKKLHLRIFDFYIQSQEVQPLGVERVPCIILSARDGAAANVKYYGLPSGYEFATLLEDIFAFSRELSPLKLQTRKALRKLDRDVHMQVFVTPG